MNTSDGTSLARAVRALARQARRVLDRPGDDAGARELAETIERIERQIEPGTSQELGRWLASLRHRVEAQATAAV